MADRPNLADPDFEPSDAQLIELSARAFAGLRSAHEESLRRLRAEVAKERALVMRELDEKVVHARDRT